MRRFLSGCGLMQLAGPVIYGGIKKGICEKGSRAAADQAGLRAAVVLSQQIPGGMRTDNYLSLNHCRGFQFIAEAVYDGLFEGERCVASAFLKYNQGAPSRSLSRCIWYAGYAVSTYSVRSGRKTGDRKIYLCHGCPDWGRV